MSALRNGPRLFRDTATSIKRERARLRLKREREAEPPPRHRIRATAAICTAWRRRLLIELSCQLPSVATADGSSVIQVIPSSSAVRRYAGILNNTPPHGHRAEAPLGMSSILDASLIKIDPALHFHRFVSTSIGPSIARGCEKLGALFGCAACRVGIAPFGRIQRPSVCEHRNHLGAQHGRGRWCQRWIGRHADGTELAVAERARTRRIVCTLLELAIAQFCVKLRAVDWIASRRVGVAPFVEFPHHGMAGAGAGSGGGVGGFPGGGDGGTGAGGGGEGDSGGELGGRDGLGGGGDGGGGDALGGVGDGLGGGGEGGGGDGLNGGGEGGGGDGAGGGGVGGGGDGGEAQPNIGASDEQTHLPFGRRL
eukprot:scaffold3499_cov117-Isochrysis_galbana.AAC.19